MAAAAVAGVAGAHPTASQRPEIDAGISRLRKRVGDLATPRDNGYDAARAAWNLTVDQRPLLAVTAANEYDIVATVRFAHDQGLGVAVQATGHGVTTPADDGVLINTSGLRGVHIDPVSSTATVEAGVTWRDVVPKAAEFGLAPLCGSSSGVGVVGYTLGGGSGFLGRQYGFAADSVTGARIATACGEVLDVSASEYPDLFWALRGGTSNFGIVTRLRFRLYPVHQVYGGGIYWPIEWASEVADAYREFVQSVPESATTRLSFVHVPPLPAFPEGLRGKWLVAVQGAFIGSEAEGTRLFRPFRLLGGAIEDALGPMPWTAADSIARDPKDPLPAVMHTDLVNEISPDLIRYLAEDVCQPSSRVAIIELRHQGGAFGCDPEVPSAVGVRPTGFWFNGIASAMSPGGREAAESDLRQLRSSMRRFATGFVFLNGIDAFNSDRVKFAYSADTWARLRQVKRRYDPTNVFRLNRNVPAA